MLVQLGFRPSGVVKKTRVTYHLAIDGRKYELALDDVDGLGMFLEIETLAEESEKESARDGVLELARKLGLPADAPERRSYLALVLALSDG